MLLCVDIHCFVFVLLLSFFFFKLKYKERKKLKVSYLLPKLSNPHSNNDLMMMKNMLGKSLKVFDYDDLVLRWRQSGRNVDMCHHHLASSSFLAFFYFFLFSCFFFFFRSLLNLNYSSSKSPIRCCTPPPR